VLFRSKVTIGENSVIGYRAVILAHEFLIKEYRVGEVVIGKDVVIGANCTILPGVRIEDGSVVSACSFVNSDVKGFVGGVPARAIRTRSEHTTSSE
jgi:acetyltransferase-like isoleucine patch superfamily enzyme